MIALGTIQCTEAYEVLLAVNRVPGIGNRLTVMGVATDEALLVSFILRALPATNGYLEYWQLLDVEQQTLDRLISKLNEKAKAIASVGADEVARFAVDAGR